MVVGGIEARRLVFVDECGANICLVPLYAWSRRGVRAPAKAPRNWGKNVTLLSSMSIKKGDGAVPRGRRGDHWRGVRGISRSSARPNAFARAGCVVMDNLSAHKGSRVREIVEGRGCELMYVPRPTRRISTP